jgi:uncharacterized hydrophobic protein (TIGR00271 family)
VLRLTLSVPGDLSGRVVDALSDDAAVSSLAVLRDASVRPAGDVVIADVAREATDGVVARLVDLGVHREGTLRVDEVETWVSQRGFDAERLAPGSSADAVVWAEVTQQAYEDSELNWTYASFMCLATIIAAIALLLDSQVLVIGAMVLGPEFGAVVALGVGLVRRRPVLLRRAALTLFLGFVLAIVVTAGWALVAEAIGWVTIDDFTRPRPDTSFVFSPDRWSIVVAVIAGAAGVLSLTSARLGGLSGVFISVTTVPAAGSLALSLTFGAWTEARGSALQLLVNILGMAVAGWATLLVQQTVWHRVARRLSLKRAGEPPPGLGPSRARG